MAEFAPDSKKRKSLVSVVTVIVLMLAGYGLWQVARGPAYALSVTEIAVGPTDAPVIIEEYSDFQCPACRQAAPGIKEAIKSYPNQVRFVYRHFPLPSHALSRQAAQAATCAADQGKFADFHDKLFERQPQWERMTKDEFDQVLRTIVSETGVDAVKWDTCRTSRTVKSYVQDEMAQGVVRQVSSTPTFFVNGAKIEGIRTPFQWDQLIKEELGKKGITPETAS